MTGSVFPLHISTRFTCPGEKNICGIKARIRDFGSCIIRVFAIESNPPRSKSDRPRHEVEVKGEYRVKECAECPFNPVAAEITRELLHPSGGPRSTDEAGNILVDGKCMYLTDSDGRRQMKIPLSDVSKVGDDVW